MGCSISKYPSKQDSRNPTPSYNSPVPTQSARVEAENQSKITWKSRTSRLPKSSVLASDLKSIVTLPGQQVLKPVEEEEPEEQVETANGQIGFRNELAASVSAFEARRRKVVERSASVHPIETVTVESKSSDRPKRSAAGELESISPWSEDMSMESMVKSPHRSLRSFSSREGMPEVTGLRLLLCPVDTTPHRFTSLTGRTLNKSLASDRSFNMGFRGDNFSPCPEMLDIDTSSCASDEEPDSFLFDPSILATFEKAVEAVSDDNWPGSDISIGSSSEHTSSSSETCSDADSRELPKEICRDLEEAEFSSTKDSKRGGEMPQRREAISCNKIDTFTKRSHFDHANVWPKEDYLDFYESRCPPGCAEKLVLYFTSLRGIRKTFEDCCTLRSILKGFGLQVDERDVSMHSKFRQELTDVMGSAVSVPRLFMKGRYIGGAEEVKRLHEEGILRKLFAGLPTEWRNMCDLCGDVRFVPCITCSGSCKTISQDDKEKSRCPDCNENGLILCPSCEW